MMNVAKSVTPIRGQGPTQPWPKIGDGVRLKSGGPTMTFAGWNKHGECRCVLAVGESLSEISLPGAALFVVTPAAPPIDAPGDGDAGTAS